MTIQKNSSASIIHNYFGTLNPQALSNQVPNLQKENLENENHLLRNVNDFLASALINAMPQIPNLNGFLQVYGAGLVASSEAIRNWNEARKNGGGIGGGIGGGLDDGKKGDGKKGSDGTNGADGWLKSGCFCPETPPCPVVIPCPEPVVCNLVEIQTQLNSTLKSLSDCQKLNHQSNDDLNVCLSHKTETQGWLTDCQKEYAKLTSLSSKDDSLISLRNCQIEYQKENTKKERICHRLKYNHLTTDCDDLVFKIRKEDC
ncbi:hypothetical protein ACTFIZ_004902 [Dictyostelium cf. discoideum]